MGLINIRKWDTEFFGIKVGELRECPSSENLNPFQQEIEYENYQFLLYRHKVDPQNILNISTLAKLGFSYIDTHLKLNLSLSELESNKLETKISKVTIRKVAKSEQQYVPELQRIGVDLSKVSRFGLDLHISEELVTKLYQNWIKNGFVGNMADHIYVAFDEFDTVLGFAYFVKEKDDSRIVDLSLLAVDSSMRGSGLGTKLMETAFSDLQEQYDHCTVVVSLSNPKAVRFYEKLGYRLLSSEQIYHMHKD